MQMLRVEMLIVCCKGNNRVLGKRQSKSAGLF